jgi:hypothetical protein
MAMFADITTSGGEWIIGFDENCSNNRDFGLPPNGGRKTTGYAETEDILELYDGPRRYVAMVVTHVYDWKDLDEDGEVDLEDPVEVWPVVDVIITYIFNKVKKEVMMIKDIKQVISGKILQSPLDIQFSNREEWDLGAPGAVAEYGSYAHWWHQYFKTCYGPEWHMAPGIMREYEITWIAGPGDNEEWCKEESEIDYGCYAMSDFVEGSVRVRVNGKWIKEGTLFDEYQWEGSCITFQPGFIESDDRIEIIFKLWKYGKCDTGGDEVTAEGGGWEGGPDAGVPHLYDVVQVIGFEGVDEDPLWVGAKAFWPVPSDYTVDGWDEWGDPLINVGVNDMSPEPKIPFTIAEWDTMLASDIRPSSEQ